MLSTGFGESLPLSALKLLDQLGLGKYKKRFEREDITETSMLRAMLAMPQVRRHGSRAAAQWGRRPGGRSGWCGRWLMGW